MALPAAAASPAAGTAGGGADGDVQRRSSDDSQAAFKGQREGRRENQGGGMGRWHAESHGAPREPPARKAAQGRAREDKGQGMAAPLPPRSRGVPRPGHSDAPRTIRSVLCSVQRCRRARATRQEARGTVCIVYMCIVYVYVVGVCVAVRESVGAGFARPVHAWGGAIALFNCQP